MQQLEHLTSFVKDCDKKVEVNKKRLEDSSEDYDGSPEVFICLFLFAFPQTVRKCPLFEKSLHQMFLCCTHQIDFLILRKRLKFAFSGFYV